MTEKDLIEYDDEESVKFIQNYLPQELKGKFSDDDLVYILDLIDEFYELKGIDTEYTDEEYEVFDREMIAYIVNAAEKDGVGKFTVEEIELVLDGEVEYCESVRII